MEEEIEVLVAGPEHEEYVDTILDTIAEAAKVRGTGIAKRYWYRQAYPRISCKEDDGG